MKRIYLVTLILLVAILFGCMENKEKLVYPKSKKVETEYNYFGTKVKDPYSWLENDTSAETMAWVKEQNKLTFDYLSKIPFREKIRERLKTIWDFPKISAPFKKAGHYFYYKNNGLQNQSVLYVCEKPDGEARVLIDPNSMSTDGTVAVSNIAISKNGKYIAYAIAKGGSDWNEIKIKEIATGADIADNLQWVKFSGLAWCGDGLYYSGYSAPKAGEELTKKNEYHKLFFHKLGTPQSQDKIIMENKKEALRMFYASSTNDEKFLIISEETSGKRGNAVHIKDLTKPNSPINCLVEEFDNEFLWIDNLENTIIFRTNQDASKYRLISIDMAHPEKENWKVIIPEKKDVLESCFTAGGKIVAQYMENAYCKIELYSIDGKAAGKIDLPGIGDVTTFNASIDDNTAYYTFASFTTPGDVYKYDVATGKSELYMSSKIKFDGTLYEIKQVFFSSKDGTKIPMFLVHKKGLQLNGNNPCLMYGYGGFNASLNPTFSTPNVVWLENGGVYAMVNLRGGGEYGKEWHEAGMKLKKQNVFDDFIAAAEYLIKEKYTCSEKLVCRGGSNGGLLIGAVINQRPELWKVALPAVGVMDMLRFQKFTIGWNWVTDYGSSDNKEEFDYIYKYSPLHNISENIDYPSVLVTTADHDDRVVPAHSFKYIATLQEKYKGDNPVIIRIETMAGHSAGKPTSKIIDEYTDMWSFVFYNLGIKPQY